MPVTSPPTLMISRQSRLRWRALGLPVEYLLHRGKFFQVALDFLDPDLLDISKRKCPSIWRLLAAILTQELFHHPSKPARFVLCHSLRDNDPPNGPLKVTQSLLSEWPTIRELLRGGSVREDGSPPSHFTV